LGVCRVYPLLGVFYRGGNGDIAKIVSTPAVLSNRIRPVSTWIHQMPEVPFGTRYSPS
jgi:hypothetical protein